MAGPEGQAFPLDGIGFKRGRLLPLDFFLSRVFVVALRGPSRPADAVASLLSLSAVFTLSSQVFPSLQACAVLCCVLCRWAPVLAHLLSSAAACVRALRLTEFNSLSCYGLPFWLAVDW